MLKIVTLVVTVICVIAVVVSSVQFLRVLHANVGKPASAELIRSAKRAFIMLIGSMVLIGILNMIQGFH